MIGPGAVPTRLASPTCMRRTHLAGFKGILQVGGYGGYRVLAERGDVQLAFCWSHVRCRFTRPGRRRSPARRLSASPLFTPSRRTSVAAVPRNGVSRARRKAVADEACHLLP